MQVLTAQLLSCDCFAARCCTCIQLLVVGKQVKVDGVSIKQLNDVFRIADELNLLNIVTETIETEYSRSKSKVVKNREKFLDDFLPSQIFWGRTL